MKIYNPNFLLFCCSWYTLQFHILYYNIEKIKRKNSFEPKKYLYCKQVPHVFIEFVIVFTYARLPVGQVAVTRCHCKLIDGVFTMRSLQNGSLEFGFFYEGVTRAAKNRTAAAHDKRQYQRILICQGMLMENQPPNLLLIQMLTGFHQHFVEGIDIVMRRKIKAVNLKQDLLLC